MKKLESLNNSLFEKFQSNKINNIAAITGGTYTVTQDAQGADEFTYYEGVGSGTTNQLEMDGKKGDLCHGIITSGGFVANPVPVGTR